MQSTGEYGGFKEPLTEKGRALAASDSQWVIQPLVLFALWLLQSWLLQQVAGSHGAQPTSNARSTTQGQAF
jgi:hypothetical protein